MESKQVSINQRLEHHIELNMKPENAYLLCKGRSITVWLTSCLTGLDMAEQVNLLLIKHEQSSWIQTSQTGGQPYSDTSPNAGLPRAKYTEIEHHIFSLASYGFHLSCNKFMLAYNIFDSIQVCNSFEKASYLLLFKFD